MTKKPPDDYEQLKLRLHRVPRPFLESKAARFLPNTRRHLIATAVVSRTMRSGQQSHSQTSTRKRRRPTRVPGSDARDFAQMRNSHATRTSTAALRAGPVGACLRTRQGRWADSYGRQVR